MIPTEDFTEEDEEDEEDEDAPPQITSTAELDSGNGFLLIKTFFRKTKYDLKNARPSEMEVVFQLL